MDFLQSLQELPDLLLRIQLALEANTVVINQVNLIQLALEANTKALREATEQLGNTSFYEREAAKYIGVDTRTMYNYRQAGLSYEKVGRIISYLRKDLDDWRTAGKVHRQ